MTTTCTHILLLLYNQGIRKCPLGFYDLSGKLLRNRMKIVSREKGQKYLRYSKFRDEAKDICLGLICVVILKFAHMGNRLEEKIETVNK